MSKKGDLPLETVRKYIDETRELSIENFCIGGGEPFLRPSVLEKACAYGSKRGLDLSCTTNAFWASTYGDSLASMKQLKRSGLNFLNISVDDFHQEFIPLENIKNAVMAAQEVGIDRISLVCTRNSSTRGIEYYSFYLKEMMDVALDGITLIEEQRIPFGRDSELYPESDFKPLSSFEEGNDTMICFSLPFIDPFENFFPCCNYFVGMLGNLKHHSIGDILHHARNNQYLQTICTQGPSAVLKTLIKDGKIPSSPREFVCKCHICAYIFSHPHVSHLLED
jgi:MoaA/NifB/PqqE/SkfB family radical SAM enzyme